ncbi:MAG: glutaminase [Pseudomonadota bacterium]
METARPLTGQGRVADYIPALASVSIDQLGLAVAMLDGEVMCAGDADTPFSIQSISKVFTLALALEQIGEAVWDCVGREPSGSPFNSIVQLEHEAGMPRNPLINAGAIAVTDRLVAGRTPEAMSAELVDFLRQQSQDVSVAIDEDVAASEAETGSRNRSLAYFMASFGNLVGSPETALAAYFRQCSVAMTCRQLARAGLFLANGGRDPRTGEQVVSTERARRLNAVMLTCGHYDNSGEFAFQVGLPGKSGVGGGILAIAPGRGVLAAWSPGLNPAGTSAAGAAALEHFASAAGWSVFD